MVLEARLQVPICGARFGDTGGSAAMNAWRPAIVVDGEYVRAANVQPDTHGSATAAKAAAQLSEIRFGGCGSGGMP
jgi:hypothetical protein